PPTPQGAPAEDRPSWPPIRALAGDGPRADRRRPMRPRQIVVAVLAALGVGALLGSGALVGLAERQPLGTQRDVALGAAKVTDRLAHGLSLNRPAERLAEALDGEEQTYDVEALIADARATAPTTTEPSQPPPVAEDPEVDEPAAPPAAADPVPGQEPAAAEDPGPGEGPPADGIIPPIEGVDCVAQDPSDGVSAGQVECPPGDVAAGPDEPLPPATETAEPETAGAAPDEAGTDTDSEQKAPVEVVFDGPRIPGEENPLVLYVGGDSISRDLGEGLARITPATLVRIDLDPRPATGLSRPDFFDWAQHLAGVLTESRPDVIVVLFGANDFQNVEHEGEILDRFGDEWLDLYRRRVDRIMTLLGQPGTQTIWVGQPPVRETRLSGGLERLNTVYAEVAARHPQITYVDTWALFSDDGGAYVDEIDGVRLRREDGVHLTVDGGNRLAEAVWDMIAPAWGLG
ncbi:MAG: DUF459 domain-containing protein, partial [Acidimicrobiia bacterium]|nr:DUF459 domain-containing protein [Acidimicrobiia bacterium]